MARIEEFRSLLERENYGLPAFPLPVLDTAEMIEEMGVDWKLPRRCGAEELIQPWVEFCDLALEGGKIVKEMREGSGLKLDFAALGAWSRAMRILGRDFEKRKKTIEAARRAFGALLGTEKTEEMKLEDPNKARELVGAFEEHLLARATL